MSAQRSPDEIRAEIADTREELADTAAALAHKTDVKARAKDRVDVIKDDVKEKVAHVTPDSAGGAAHSVETAVKRNPVPTAAIGAAVLGFAIGYLIARRRY